jgi:hypothetical protein
VSAGRPSLLWMRDVSAQGIGTKELDDARAEFHEHWKYGSEQIAELTGKFADSVGESLLELVPQEQQAGFLEQLAQARALTSEMQREGVVSFAMGVHEGDAGAMLESVVMLARREIPWTPPKPAAAQAATARENALPIAVADLPCGPGASPSHWWSCRRRRIPGSVPCTRRPRICPSRTRGISWSSR